MTYIRLIFVLYWFAPFLKFGPQPSENPRCSPAIIPSEALLKIYKSFVIPHLDYGDVIYDHAFNESSQNKLESAQYNAALAITRAIRGSSREKLYQELGLESLKSRRWYQKLCLFFKFFKKSTFLLPL